ncbi:MAG: kelch repeat-containing protein [Candidatus Palauibacterales bacterium]|nr:kelch repeat-containing protein [Candidatus Palauibacterales bacterium]MDP2530004.1 kelch repeat-containing protein [Candidatus Palauibacterales bacterium]MDP2585029.1 kelch repeat-containing protein [Candidatus Palauibacterales bacterium]
MRWLKAAIMGGLIVAVLTVAGVWGPARGGAEATGYRVEPAGHMASDRAAHQATLLQEGDVLVTGGCTGNHCGRTLASAELYDPATRRFHPAAPMHVPRASHAAARLPDGRVLVAGGWDGSGPTATAEVYDPRTDAWTRVGDMTTARASGIAVPLADGRVLVAGGGQGRLGNLASVEVFDPATSTFSAVGSAATNHYLATRLADGRVLLTGGEGADGSILATSEILDPGTGTFAATGAMATARVKHAAALLHDGRVLVIGGSDRRGYAARFASTELYEPGSGTFSPGPDLRRGRHKIRDAIAVLPSGDVVVAGGAARPEVYDHARHAFVPVDGDIGGPRMFATATLLPSGDVLVLGGYDDHTQPSAAAWLIEPGTP